MSLEVISVENGSHPKRHKGYVSGRSRSGKSWIVRVKDEDSEHHGARMPVASIRDDITLVRGLNVHFCVGTFDNSKGKQALRAVDVCLCNPFKVPNNE